MLLATNTSSESLDRRVGLRGVEGLELVESRRFAVDERALRDELNTLDQLVAEGPIGLDTANSAYFGDDASRAFRTEASQASLSWQVEGEIQLAEVAVWRWPDEAEPALSWSWSSDGESWSSLQSSVSSSQPRWIRDLHRLEPPEAAGWLRLTFPPGGTSWNPQVGDAWITWVPEEIPAQPALAGEDPRVVELSLPPWSATAVVLEAY